MFLRSRLSQRITPYLALGIGIVVTLVLLALFFYLLFWGMVVGLVLYVVMRIRRAFIKKRSTYTKVQGQVYEHDDTF